MLTNYAQNYANQLLSDLGIKKFISQQSDHPALAYRRSGLLQISDQMLPVPLASHADGALLALKAISENISKLPKCGSQLLGERARIRGLRSGNRKTAGGKGRLINTNDGCIALNLVRDSDWDLIPAWLEDDVSNWSELQNITKKLSTNYLLSRAIDMGLAVGEVSIPDRPKSWFSFKEYSKAILKKPLILDLSSLWAGPLGSSLLGMTGARIIKIESPDRPDGMRFGNGQFYNLLNENKDCVSIDFHNEDGLEKLKQLMHQADVIIEASRPRAFMQLGISAKEFVKKKPGKIWLRLTAYSRDQNRIGYGDDIGVSAGLSGIMNNVYGHPSFVGDAIADPINGLHLALILQASLHKRIGGIIDLNMCEVLRYAMGEYDFANGGVLEGWKSISDNDADNPLYEMRVASGQAKGLGADNSVWL